MRSFWSSTDAEELPPQTTKKNPQYLQDEKLISEFCIRYASYKHTVSDFVELRKSGTARIHLLEMQNNSLKVQLKLLNKNERRKSHGAATINSTINLQIADDENARNLMIAQKQKKQSELEGRIKELQDELTDYRKTFKLWWRWRR